MKKLATMLTPTIKAWIKKEFGSDFYKDNPGIKQKSERKRNESRCNI